MKYLIVVEGVADLIFIRDFIIYIFSNNSFKEKKEKNMITLTSNDIKIKIISSGGFTAIKNLKTNLITAYKKGEKIILIQDADSKTKDSKYGGKKLRLKFIQEYEQSNKINISSFLFPNHNDDGDLEDLLLKIINISKYEDFCNCFNNYVTCSNKIADKKHGDELLENKNKVYNYIRTYFGMKLASEPNRKYCQEIWELDHDELLPLKSFLLEIIKF